MTTTRIDDHVAQGLARLLDQYKGKPRLAAWVSSYLKPVQELEDLLWSILDKHILENAVGEQLDTLGIIVGQPRIGETDDIYRMHIRVRIRINHSLGLPNDVIDVASLLFPGLRFTYLEYYPASFVVDVLDPMTEDPIFAAALLGQARAAGVGHSLHFSFDDEDDTFLFAESDEEEDDFIELRGMSDDDEDDEGGALIDCI